MKRTLASIIAVSLLVIQAAGCSSLQPVTEELRLAETHVYETPSAGIAVQEDSVISLSDLTAPMHMTVDAAGIIYVGDIDAIYSMREDSAASVFAEGLNRCVGLSASGGVMYLFDARIDGLYMLTYDLQGGRLDEQEIPLDADPAGIWRCVMFETLPVAFIQFSDASGLEPHLYNADTGQTGPLENAWDYDFLNPLPNARILAGSYGALNQTYILSIGADLSVAAKEETAFGGFYQIVHDTLTGKDYAIDENGIFLHENGVRTYAAPNPCDSGGFLEARSAGGRFYFLATPHTGGVVLMTASIPASGAENSVLRIDAGIDPDYIRYFRSRHPGIEVIMVELTWEDYGLALLSGEMEIDVIRGVGSQLHIDAGIPLDLSAYPPIVRALSSDELLDGLQQNFVKPGGAIYSVPVPVGYSGYAVNRTLFETLALT